ncbi:MAG TPA: Calx-beta domain-containing protein [Prolixibacteraceae bacterium]|nr:Calx-beta domain-containing protein [Prolixibacteraceae bacterium]
MTGTSNTDVTVAASPNNAATVTITDDDVAELSIVATTQAEEDATDGVFTISTTKQFDAPVTVTFAGTGDANAGTDFTAIGTTVEFPALSNSVTIPIEVIADDFVEGDETVIVTMNATNNSDVTIAASPDNTANITITDDDYATLRITRKANAYENVSDGSYYVITDKQFDSDVNVGVSAGGTATAGTDYTAIVSPQLFPANTDTLTITVAQLDDSESEINEYVILNLLNTNNARVSIAPAPDSTATVTIFDDDQPLVVLSQSVSSFSESGGKNAITATLNKVHHTNVYVTLAASGTSASGVDFVMPATITIPAGSLSASDTLRAVQDQLVEADETVVIDILSITNGVENGTQQVSSTIIDDDNALLHIAAATNVYENISDGSYFVITDKQFDADIEVSFSVSGTATAGADYTALASPVIFPAYTDTLTIAVQQIDDSESEIIEYVIMNLLGTNNAKVGIMPAPDSTATITIIDDDMPLVELSQSALTFSEASGQNILTATLNKVHHDDVVVSIAANSGTATPGTDFSLPASITVEAGEITGSTTVTAIQDNLVESNETLTIEIASVLNGVENGTQEVSSTIIDDDNALLRIAAATNVYENISDGSYFVITDKQFDADIEVSFSVSGTATAGADYTALASPVIFPAYTDTLTIAVQQIDDSESEIIEYVIMNLLGTNNAKVGIMPAPDSTATITIIDDDMPLVELSQSALTFSEASGQNILTATLNKVHHDDVVVSIAANSGTATPGTDFSLPASITVEAGEITGSTTVTAIQDNLVESNETLTIEIASVLNGVENGTQEVSSTIIDDDIATLSIVATSHAAEDATNGLFTIFTNKQFDTPSTITFTLGGTATEGVDFLPVGTTVLFPAFTDYIEIPVEIVADDLIESKETVIIELTGTSAGNVLIGAQDKQTIAITDNDYGYLTASVNHHPTEGDGSQGIITIYSSKTVGSPVEVFFATDGTATQGADYAFSSPKVIIPEGADSVNVLADIFDDKLVEGNEYLTFVITGTSTKAIVADSTWANLLHMDIYDNDKAYIWLEPLADMNENGTPGLFAIRTDKPVQRDLEVEIFSYGSAIAGIDYVAPQRWFTYPAGDTSMTIPVIPIPDEIVESADSIVFSLLQVNCPNTVMKRDDHDAIALFIADDDSALISIAADSPVDENIQQAGFTLSTSKAFDVPVLVYYSLSGTATIGADFSVAPAPLLLPTLANVARIPVSIIDDASIEGTETITVTIDSIMHAKAATDQGASSATLLVNDNDFVTLSVSSSERINERGFASFALTLGQAMETGITVTVSVGGTATEGTDFLALGRTFTIPAGQTELLLPVTIISDQVNEGDETIVVSIVSVSNAAVRPSLPASATLTITDDDPLPSISVLPASALENQGKISFLAKLSRTSGSLVSFVFSTSASGSADILSDFVYASDTLVFEPGETVKPIDITIIDDEAEEPDETFFLLLSDPQNAQLLADSVAGTIINDDGRPVVTIRFTEQGIDENGGTAYLKASLDRVSGKEVSVFLAFDGEAENGTDVDVAANSFVLAPGMLADSILVTGLPDDIDETNEHLTVSVTATENAALAPGTILSLLVSDQDQTIHFEPVDQTVYGGPSFDLSASSSSGLIPVFSSDNQGVASIQGNTVTIKGAGTALITASQPGNGYFDPAGEVSQLLVVGKAELSVSVLPAQRQYGEEDPLFDLAFNGFVNGDSESSIDAEPIAVSSASAQSAPGVYTVTLSGGSDNNYSFAYLHGSLTVEKADQTIVFDLPGSVSSTEPLALGATASSGLTVYYESSDLDVVRINGNTAIIVGPGTVTITARQDGDANYLPAESVSKTMVVNTVSAGRFELDGPLCFPNPFVNVITLNQACSGATMVQVLDLAGRVVLERKNPGLNIDASALRNGSYLINITLKNGAALNQLIIKK